VICCCIRECIEWLFGLLLTEERMSCTEEDWCLVVGRSVAAAAVRDWASWKT
jgi:hypothetical protein